MDQKLENNLNGIILGSVQWGCPETWGDPGKKNLKIIPDSWVQLRSKLCTRGNASRVKRPPQVGVLWGCEIRGPSKNPQRGFIKKNEFEEELFSRAQNHLSCFSNFCIVHASSSPLWPKWHQNWKLTREAGNKGRRLPTPISLASHLQKAPAGKRKKFNFKSHLRFWLLYRNQHSRF